MQDIFCSGCGSKLEEGQFFCPKCGREVGSYVANQQRLVEKYIIYNKEKKSVGNTIRNIFGWFFCILGILGIVFIICGKYQLVRIWFGIIYILIGFSFFPKTYSNYICKIVKNSKLLKILQVILPITLFIILVKVPININDDSNNNNSSIIETETLEEKVLKAVKDNLYLSYQSIDNYEINLETSNYDFKIKENKNDLTAYACASDLQYLAKKIAGTDRIGNIQFECITNNQTIYYVSIDNISSLTSNQINENTKYFDYNHNEVDTNMDTLKESALTDFKNSCATYNYKDVLRNPEDYKGKRTYWFGKIVQVIDKSSYSSTFRIDVTCEKNDYINGYYCDDTIYVTYYGNQSFIEDDMVKMWGIMDGTKTYTTVLGASITIPNFNAHYMELQ